MAGLEVAGIVLGSIPLIVSALEHYGEGVAIMKTMRDFECVFDDIQTQFAASVGIYMDSCYQLLGPLNLPDSQMNELLDQRKREAWSDPLLEKAIETRLGANFKVYLSLMAKLNKRIMLFCRKLKLNDDLKPPWVGPDGSIDEKVRKKFFKSTWTRIRGGFDSDKYATLLRDIDRDIDKLSKLSAGAIQLEPLRAEKRNRLQSIYWQTIRDQAQRLFESLSSRFTPCACNHPHKANLRLDVRKGNAGTDDATRFAFLLTFEEALCGTNPLPWNWRDIEIESSHLTSSNITVTTLPTSSVRKTAHFETSTTVSSRQPAPSRLPSPSLAARIDNLCEALIDEHQSERCLGVLEDQPWHHHVYSVTGPGCNKQISEATSLKDIINGNRFLASRQKCTLALTLASSVLQLHNTPWLPRSWETKDIFILKSRSGTTIPSQFYVSQTFSSSAAVTAASKRRRCVKNEMVFALGVALLELTYGAPVISFKEADDLNEEGKEDSMTEVSIANRLARELIEHESENYAKAVFRCITCNFDTFTFDFENGEFREKFYEGVVVPLQLDYEHATGGKI